VKENRVKILFRFYSDLLEEEMVETVWATVVDEKNNFYKIDNIPFYIPDIASDDVIRAKFNKEENLLVFEEVVEYSGNSLIRVIIVGEVEINIIRDYFKKLDCASERKGNKYLVIEVPKKVDYSRIKIELEKLARTEKIDYAEAVLAENHQYE